MGWYLQNSNFSIKKLIINLLTSKFFATFTCSFNLIQTQKIFKLTTRHHGFLPFIPLHHISNHIVIQALFMQKFPAHYHNSTHIVIQSSLTVYWKSIRNALNLSQKEMQSFPLDAISDQWIKNASPFAVVDSRARIWQWKSINKEVRCAQDPS